MLGSASSNVRLPPHFASGCRRLSLQLTEEVQMTEEVLDHRYGPGWQWRQKLVIRWPAVISLIVEPHRGQA